MKRGRTGPFSSIGGTGIPVSGPIIMRPAQRVSISIRTAWVQSVTVMSISGGLPSLIPRTFDTDLFQPSIAPVLGYER